MRISDLLHVLRAGSRGLISVYRQHPAIVNYSQQEGTTIVYPLLLPDLLLDCRSAVGFHGAVAEKRVGLVAGG